MDDHLSLFPFPPSEFASFNSNPSSSNSNVQVLPSCQLLDPWFVSNDDVAAAEAGSDSMDIIWHSPAETIALSPDHHHGLNEQSLVIHHSANTTTAPAPEQATSKRRTAPAGGPRHHSKQSANHVENERQRRDKMNRRFCELRAAVPTVSRMDKTSLLADAAAYINQLRARVAQLEAQLQATARRPDATSAPAASSSSASRCCTGASDDEVAVQVLRVAAGAEVAVVRVASAALHAPAALMAALRSLELPVRHACVSRVDSITTQDVVVDMPPGAGALQDDLGLRAALLERIQYSTAVPN